MKPYVAKKPKSINSALSFLIGETVCVSWVSDRNQLRKCFEPQISVQAKLEGSADTGKFRVMVDDNNYSYFYDDSVWAVAQNEGKRAIIFIDA
jgi:hypothetical protein